MRSAHPWQHFEPVAAPVQPALVLTPQPPVTVPPYCGAALVAELGTRTQLGSAAGAGSA
jgi:hypothetical protein